MTMMRRTLLIEPYDYVRETFSGDGRLAFYAQQTISCTTDVACEIFEIAQPLSSTFERIGDIVIDDVKEGIASNIPLYYRWMGESDTYEDNQRSFLIFVLRMVEVLRQLDVKEAVFFTGVAHHIEYSLIEIACRFASVRQIFFYPMPFGSTGRLLPLVQEHSIEDRSFLGLELSEYDFRDDVAAYRENYLACGVPKQNELIGGPAVRRSNAYFKLVERDLRRWAKALLRPASPSSHMIDRRRGYGFTSMLRIINRQKRSLDYYLSKAISNAETLRLIAEQKPLPLLYAHYQPEASTFPEGGRFTDHLDVVLAIRKAGYKGKILYKEHPASWIYYSKITGFSLVGISRSEDYYRQLEALGCVFLQPRFRIDGELMRQVFPVTITGSIAVERSLTGWRTCCAGVPWFKQAPGIENIETCFGPSGSFYDPDCWTIGKNKGAEWFADRLSRRTITNFPGIGTGVGSQKECDRREFLDQLCLLVDALSGCATISGSGGHAPLTNEGVA